MKIINRKQDEKEFPQNVTCKYCGTELEVDKEDISIGMAGAWEYICPCCKKINQLDNYYDEITKDNLNFPQHYFYFGNGKDVNNNTINNWVQQCINYLNDNPTENTKSMLSGNAIITVSRICETENEEDEEYYIVVSKNYYEAYIPSNKKQN